LVQTGSTKSLEGHFKKPASQQERSLSGTILWGTYKTCGSQLEPFFQPAYEFQRG